MFGRYSYTRLRGPEHERGQTKGCRAAALTSRGNLVTSVNRSCAEFARARSQERAWGAPTAPAAPSPSTVVTVNKGRRIVPLPNATGADTP